MTLKFLNRFLRWTYVALTATILFYSLWTWKTPGVLYFSAANHIWSLGSHNGQFRLNLFYSPNSAASDFTFEPSGSHYYLTRTNPYETWAIIRVGGEDYWKNFRIANHNTPDTSDIDFFAPFAIFGGWTYTPSRNYLYFCFNFPQWLLFLPWPIYLFRRFLQKRQARQVRGFEVQPPNPSS